MSTHPPLVMAKILTWEEMTERFDGEWLLIIHAELDEYMGVISGEVVAHSQIKVRSMIHCVSERGIRLALNILAKFLKI